MITATLVIVSIIVIASVWFMERIAERPLSAGARKWWTLIACSQFAALVLVAFGAMLPTILDFSLGESPAKRIALECDKALGEEVERWEGEAINICAYGSMGIGWFALTISTALLWRLSRSAGVSKEAPKAEKPGKSPA